MSQESDVVYSCRIGSLIRWDKQGHGGYIAKFRRPIGDGCEYVSGSTMKLKHT